ncbi:MAG: NgoFVII family restriction endonuclease, partial [Alphaproteobacteria bacterium]|nr:NgoFVII family restriction endonuclease [Alphaproteobacteria bacterium]
MKILYSNILPLSMENGKQTVLDCFIEQAQKADSIEIATGYVSDASLTELDAIVKHYGVSRIVLTIGMYFIEGMPEKSYHSAIELNQKWRERGIGEIRLVKPFKYHGKLYSFLKDGVCFATIMGSANMGVIKPDANSLRQYEIASLTEDPAECSEFLAFIKKLKDERCSSNISDILNVPLIHEKKFFLDGMDRVSRITQERVKLYFEHQTNTSFILPIKVPAFDERFMDDNKHYTKSNINVCYARPRSKRKSRDWYEVQMTVSKDITKLEGYPKKNSPFFVVTDDGYWFKAHTTSDGNKQFSAVGDELLMGRWIKGRLVAAGLVTPVN